MRDFKIAIVFIIISLSINAQNLINTDDWVSGTNTDNLSNYVNNGPISNTFLENGIDPFGNTSTLWRVNSKLNENYTRYYGFRTKEGISSNVDTSKDYRYTVWVKMLGDSPSDVTQYGTFVAGIQGVNGYKFISNSGSELTQYQARSGGNFPSNVVNDEWFLLVFYIKGSNSQSNLDDGGVYNDSDAILAGPLAPGSVEFHPSSTPNFQLFTHLRFNPTTNPNDLQSLQFFDPRFEKVEGAPSIDALRNIGSAQAGNSVWIQTSDNIHFNTGNVGIGTTSPDSKLTVKGKIHAEEVKVDLSVPGPDYVFKEDYDLNTLEEVQRYIKENGHLPNIPSAKEMEENGVELGILNMKLLEKIEELTLYTIEQQKELKEQKEINQNLRKRLEEIEKVLVLKSNNE